MKARVRNIKNGKIARTKENWNDFLVPDMKPGQTISVSPLGGCPGWYRSKSSGYEYHESWLEFE